MAVPRSAAPLAFALVLLGYLASPAAGLRPSSTPRHPHPQNADGNLFVDKTCIDCDTCRWMAPSTFGRTGRAPGHQSYVYRQPASPTDVDAALAAVVACPTGSIRLREPDARMKAVVSSFPRCVDGEALPRVFHLGHHSRKSFGATAYLVAGKSADGTPLNVMVDTPRYTSRLAKAVDATGGLHMHVMTHKDDVADMPQWKGRYPDLERVMHQSDVRGPDSWPYIDMTGVERQLGPPGAARWELAPGFTAVWTPGHSEGSISFIADGRMTGGESCVFTGDTLAFNGRLGRLDGFGRYGDDLEVQAASIASLARGMVGRENDSDDAEHELKFTWVLPGHGRRYRFASDEQRRAQLAEAAAVFAEGPYGTDTAKPVFHFPAA